MDRALILASRAFASALACAALAGMVTACSGGGSSVIPAPPSTEQLPGGNVQTNVAAQAYDVLSGGPCDVSYDGQVWYTLSAGHFPPIDAAYARCRAAASLHVDPAPPIPNWAHAPPSTQALFVATSLMEHPYSPSGVMALHAVAAQAHVPVTWMIGNVAYLQQGNYEVFNQYHAADGDDVEMEDDIELLLVGRQRFPWYAPTVAVEGAGHERRIAWDLQHGEHGFWGITWNSLRVDLTSDMGTPWGSYCADPASYKRPSPTGNCTMVGFEWTARDLTRAFFTGHEEYFSTDPDDVLVRAQFSPSSGAAYVRAIADAYAAAGQSQPLVMMSQQEAPEMIDGASGDATVLSALYSEAVADGMKPLTLASVLPLAQGFSNRPRAIAFPFIPGGGTTFLRNGSALEPSTLDYHDNVAGMTFIGGHTTPARLFLYAQDPASYFNRPLVQYPDAQLPQLTMAKASGGRLYFQFKAAAPLHYGVALWADPNQLGISGDNVSVSGHAAAVVTFDLPAGVSDQSVACAQCTDTTLPLSL